MMTFRLERGQLDAAEFAVLAVVLSTVLAGPRPAVSRPPRPVPAPWWQAGQGYRPPGSSAAKAVTDQAWP